MGFKRFARRLKTKVFSLFSKRRKKGPRKRRQELLISQVPELVPSTTSEKGGYLDRPTVPVIRAINEFSVVQLSAHTQRAYKKDLADYFSYLKSRNIWESWNFESDPTLVADYRTHLLESRKLSKSSVTRKLAVLKSFYRWCNARGWMRENPAELVKSFPQTQESKTGFLDEREIYKLLDIFPPMHLLGLHKGLCKVVIETLLMLGVRRSEASKIRAGDMEYLDGRWLVKVQGKGDRERRLPIPPRLCQTWAEWLARISEEAPRGKTLDEDPLSWLAWMRRNPGQPILISTRAKNYHSALSSSEIARIVRKSGRYATLTNRLSPHMLRATAITYALDQGASHRGVQQMAGWTSPLMITRYDKRRKDPRFSAIMQLKYATLKNTKIISEVKEFADATKSSNEASTDL